MNTDVPGAPWRSRALRTDLVQTRQGLDASPDQGRRVRDGLGLGGISRRGTVDTAPDILAQIGALDMSSTRSNIGDPRYVWAWLAHMSHGQAAEWLDDISDVPGWVITGMWPDDAREWYDHGFADEQALRWAIMEFTPAEASAWAAALLEDDDPTEAAFWRALGFTPEEAGALMWA